MKNQLFKVVEAVWHKADGGIEFSEAIVVPDESDPDQVREHLFESVRRHLPTVATDWVQSSVKNVELEDLVRGHSRASAERWAKSSWCLSKEFAEHLGHVGVEEDLLLRPLPKGSVARQIGRYLYADMTSLEEEVVYCSLFPISLKTPPRKAMVTTQEARKVFGSSEEGILGFEVTDGARVEINIDPQHGYGSPGFGSGMSAAMATLLHKHELQIERFSVFTTTRADLDSVCSMAVAAYSEFEKGRLSADQEARLEWVNKTDQFQMGDWKPTALPTKDKPWPDKQKTAGLTAVGAMCADSKLPLWQRVCWAADWIKTGSWDSQEEYENMLQNDRQCLIEDIEHGETTVETKDGIAVVVSNIFGANTLLGYAVAPVVVSFWPEREKFTISGYSPEVVDFQKLQGDLDKVEPGWGGNLSSGIIGSPHGGTKLSIQEVTDLVRQHLRPTS